MQNVLLNMTDVVTNTPTLIIPPERLIPGRVYTVYVAGFYDVPEFREISRVEIETSITCEFNSIYSYFKQGYEIKTGDMQDLLLETETYDPDSSYNDGRGLSYHWIATPVIPSLLDMFGRMPDQKVLSIPRYSLVQNATYHFNVTVTKANASSSDTRIDVIVGFIKVPYVTISSGDLRLNHSLPMHFGSVDLTRTLSILGKVHGPGNGTYRWTLEKGEFYTYGLSDTSTFIGYNKDIVTNTVEESSHVAGITHQDLAIKPDTMMREVDYGFRLTTGDFNAPNNTGLGFSTFEIKATGPPIKGSFNIMWSGSDSFIFVPPVVSMITEITMSASSWKDTNGDQPLYYQFGFMYYDPSLEWGVSHEVYYIIQPFSEVNSVSTRGLPPGVLVPLLWIKDRYGSSRLVKFGCELYKTGSVYRTELNCPGVQTLTVENIPLGENGAYPSTYPEAITQIFSGGNMWQEKNYDVVAKLAMYQCALGIVNAIKVDNYLYCNPACVIEAHNMRLYLISKVMSTIETGETVSPTQILGVTAMAGWSDKRIMSSAMVPVNVLLDAGLAFATQQGLTLHGARNALEVVTMMAAAQNQSAHTGVDPDGLVYIGTTNLSTRAAAHRIRDQVTKIGSAAIQNFIVNGPVIPITTVNTTDGAILLELSLYRGTDRAMKNAHLKMLTMSVKTPPAGVFNEPYDWSKPDDIAKDVRQVFTCTFSAWYANPYAYDIYRVLKSAVALLKFSKIDGVPISFIDMPQAYRPVVGLKLSFTSGSPKCFYRDPNTDWDGWVNPGVETLNPPRVETIGTNASDTVYCETDHNSLLDDFAISDGCYQHRQLTKSESCSSHGFCNLDTTCHCVCGYFTNNCSKVHTSAMKSPSKNRYFSGAPLKMHLTYNATGGRIALVRQQRKGIFSCQGAGKTPLNSYSGSFQHKLVKWGIEIQQEVPQTAGSKLPVLNETIMMPHVPNTPVAPGEYTVCFCNAEKVNDPEYANCDMDCAYLHRNDTITVIDEPRLGPIGDFGDGRAVSGIPATFRLTAGAYVETALKNGDMVYLAKDCSEGPTGSASDSTGIMRLFGMEMTFLSAVYMLPNTLNAQGTFTKLRICFATKEMGLEPDNTEYAMLTDSIVIIEKPYLGDGTDLRSITGSWADFHVTGAAGMGTWGVDGGDIIYFRIECGGDPGVRLARQWETKYQRVIENNDPVLFPGTCAVLQGVPGSEVIVMIPTYEP